MAKHPPILVVTRVPFNLSRLCGGDRRLGHRCVVRRWDDLERAARLPRSPLAVVLALNGARPRLTASVAWLRRRFPGVPILAAGGARGAHAPHGADARVDLPLRPADLEEAVESVRRRAGEQAEKRRLRERLRQLREKLATLGAIARTAHSILEPRRVTEIVATRLRDLVRARLAVVYRFDEGTRTLAPSPVYSRGAARQLDLTLRPGEGAAGRVFETRRPLRLAGKPLGRIPGESFDARAGIVTRAYLGAPLVSRGRVLGVVELRNRGDGGSFSRRDELAVLEIVEPAALAIDNALLFQRSQELSVTDDLTKLYNSRFLGNTLSREVKRARRYGSQVSLIFLDLDGFKNVNDRHGHLIGSRTLIEVGQVLREAVREIDVVSRYGGDEFTVVLPQTGPEGALIIAERIRQAIEGRVFMQSEGLNVRLTASLGVASFPKPCDSPEALLQSADRTMYVMKGMGKNRVGVAE